jgi:hypothetical protein
MTCFITDIRITLRAAFGAPLCVVLKYGSFDKYITYAYKGFETWSWRRLENISWNDRVRNKELLHTVKEERNVLHVIKKEEL